MSKAIVIKNVVLRYGDALEATRFDADAPERYQATVLVRRGSEQDKLIRAALQAVAEEDYGKKAKQMLDSFGTNSQKICYSDYDDEHMKFSAYRYVTNVVTGKENPPPHAVGHDKKRVVKGKIYLGCTVNLSATIYTGKTHSGMRADFDGIQFVADGEAFEASRGVDAFEDLSDDASLV